MTPTGDVDPHTPSPTARELRGAIRRGTFDRPTSGVADGWVQANLVALPHAHAEAFVAFCRGNHRACPVLEVTAPGDPGSALAQRADLRTDLPRYHVYRDGELAEERTEVTGLWSEDMVGVLLGCSFTFEHALIAAGIPLRHVEQGRNVAMYRTSLECQPAQPFAGPMVVSMRPLRSDLVARAHEICSHFPDAHGPPLDLAGPGHGGIESLGRPDFGDPVDIADGEQPVFWACGVTATVAALRARMPLVITHAPGHMFVTDRRVEAAGEA